METQQPDQPTGFCKVEVLKGSGELPWRILIDDVISFGIRNNPLIESSDEAICNRLVELVNKGIQLEKQEGKNRLEYFEQYRMQMAGITVAAMGYWKEGESIHPDYMTQALLDVARLYKRYDELYKEKTAAMLNPAK